MTKDNANDIVNQHLEETALSVVLHKWGANEAIAERNALHAQLERTKKRLEELKKIYPHLFLTEGDVGSNETGAFLIIADFSKPVVDQSARVMYMGRTEDGMYRWKWNRVASALEFQHLYDTDDDGVFTSDEEDMKFWGALPSPCSDFCHGEWGTGDQCSFCEDNP